ncbi:hypothetical protein HOF92_00945 [bacterium]|nr:hypothetical protein [bacterium]
MIRIDQREYHLALEKARATQLAKGASLEQVLQERSNLKKSLELSRKNLTLNEKELKRYKEMVKEHTVTDQAYENILQKVQQQRLQVLGHENALAQIPHKITLQRANISSARISVQEAMIRLERTEIRAPFTGKLNDRKGEVGEFLGMGVSLGRLVSLESLELKIPVPQSEIKTLLGNSSTGIADLPSAGKQLRLDDSRRFVKIDPVAPKGPGVLGKISRFGAAYDPKTRTLPVYIEFTNTLSKDNLNDLFLHPGTFCKVEFTGDMLENVYEVDRTALLNDRVQVIREGMVHTVTVELARDQGATLWVRGAFEKGDELILRYTELFEDGKRVIAVTKKALL